MAVLTLLERGHLILAAALTVLGLWMAAASRPAIKRAAGAAIAQAGPMALIAAGPRTGVDLAAAAGLMALAYLILGAALAVRANETYRSQESDDLDAADDEPDQGAVA